MVFTEASASPHSPQALGICVPCSGAVHRKQKCRRLAKDCKKAVCAKAEGREWWGCNMCGCRRGTSRRDWGMPLSCSSGGWRRGNKGRVENNRTRQWHWDNLWSHLGVFNWPVSFSHLMHFHKDSSLPLVLSSCSSSWTVSPDFFCFFSPPHFKAALSRPALWCLSGKADSSKGCVILNRGRNLVQEGRF